MNSQTKVIEPHAACRGCGCTDERGCEEGCAWVEPDLCSACAEAGRDGRTRRKMYQMRPMAAHGYLVCQTLADALESLAAYLETSEPGEILMVEPLVMSGEEFDALGEHDGW